MAKSKPLKLYLGLFQHLFQDHASLFVSILNTAKIVQFFQWFYKFNFKV